MRRTTILAAAAVLSLALAACGSSTKTGGSGGDHVQVKLTDAGCSPAKLTLPPGPTTFEVSNEGADDVSEFEILDGGRILGEVENLTPGLSGTFSLTLKPGTFTTACPGGDTDTEGQLIVTGAPAGVTTAPKPNAAATTAVSTYRRYVEQEAAQLVADTTAFVNAIKAGDLARAKQLYPTTRTHYETIEPVAESFGDLDPAIDARANDVPANQFKGFHRIEQQMWQQGNLDGMEPVAAELLANVKMLQRRIPAIELEPAQIANGSVELLNEVASSKITGEEDRYSHTDLWDFEANLEGARQGFEALKPIVSDKDSELASKLEARFTSTEAALKAHQQGDGYVRYTDLTQTDTRKLAAQVDALADVLSQVAPLVVQG
jgi:iron uptake system component EfeO